MITKWINKIDLTLTIFGLSMFIVVSCKKIEREPKVETGSVTDITINSAVATGNIIDQGDGIIDYGHCWRVTSPPTTSNFKTSFGRISRTGSYTSILQNLQPATKYYIKAYVENANGEVYYGNEASFTTTAISLPTITTNPVSSITSTTASSGGNVISDGGAAVTARGVCWSTNANPTVTLSTKTTNGAGTGSFTSNITGLTGNTTYHLRAYATNSAGTAYGNDLIFTTPVAIVPPTVTTGTTSTTSSTSATSGGNVTSDGGATVTARGVCWSTSANPTISESKTSSGTGAGAFTSVITNLTPNTTYHVRAYATNSVGTAYGSDITFTTDPLIVSDNDGNTYDVIRIGTQLWTAENLKTTKYNDGTNIPLVTGNAEWSNLTTPAFCWYNNDENTYKNVYGALYNWYSVNTGKLCPAGWHVPSDAEWTTLALFLGGESVAGGKLKEAGTTHWASPNEGATNESSFTGLPGGYRSFGGEFNSIEFRGYWWSSSEGSSSSAWSRAMGYDFRDAGAGSVSKKYGFSVRCVKD